MAEACEAGGGRIIDTDGIAANVSDAAGSPGGLSVVTSALMVLKPGIAFGVSVAGFAGMTLAGGGLPGAHTGAVTLSCILFAAMGAAAMNVVAERDTDSAMRRLAARNAALDMLGRRGVIIVSSLFVACSIAAAYLLINAATAALILAAVVSYAGLYTLYLKKSTPFGMVLGGLPGALPVLIGYAAVKPQLGFDAAILFSLMLLWQPPHFLALALKYSGDYRAAGLPVMPSAIGEPYTKAFIFIYASALPPLVVSLWLFGYLSGYFAAGASLLTVLYLAQSYMDIYMAPRYGRAFMLSIAYIITLMLMVVSDVAVYG